MKRARRFFSFNIFCAPLPLPLPRHPPTPSFVLAYSPHHFFFSPAKPTPCLFEVLILLFCLYLLIRGASHFTPLQGRPLSRVTAFSIFPLSLSLFFFVVITIIRIQNNTAPPPPFCFLKHKSKSKAEVAPSLSSKTSFEKADFNVEELVLRP